MLKFREQVVFVKVVLNLNLRGLCDDFTERSKNIFKPAITPTKKQPIF